jgi:hypothetical protein
VEKGRVESEIRNVDYTSPESDPPFGLARPTTLVIKECRLTSCTTQFQGIQVHLIAPTTLLQLSLPPVFAGPNSRQYPLD